MNFLKYYIILVIFCAGCIENKSTSGVFDHKRFHQMEVGVKSDILFSPRKKAKIPFAYNQIYDPFIEDYSTKIDKSSFDQGESSNLDLIVLDTISSAMNVALRKKKEKWVKAIPVIIKNNSNTNTSSIPLHKGCAEIIQEAKNKNNEWVEVEKLKKERIGKFYYKVEPNQYVYTKIPMYKGNTEYVMRLKLYTSDTSFILSNEYSGKLKKWMVN